MTDDQPDPDAELIRDLDRVLWGVEGNCHREGSFAPSRFEGHTLQTAQARAVLREVRRPGGVVAQAVAAELRELADQYATISDGSLRARAAEWEKGRQWWTP